MRRIFGTVLITIFSICVARGTQAQETPAILPIEHFIKYDEINSPALSPDGNHIAYMTGRYGHSVLAVSVSNCSSWSSTSCHTREAGDASMIRTRGLSEFIRWPG